MFEGFEKRADMQQMLKAAQVEVTESPALDHSLASAPREDLLADMSKPAALFIRSTADACRNYLTGVYMKDRFTSKQERDDWEERMRTQFGDQFTELNDRSKLRRNLIQSVFTNIEAIVHFLDEANPPVQTPLAESLRMLKARIEDPQLETYESKTYEEKLAFVHHVEIIAHSFLELVAKGADQPGRTEVPQAA